MSIVDRPRVLLTGGTRGIGWHAARSLVDAGWHVIVAGRDLEVAQKTAERLCRRAGADAARAVFLDLGRLATVEALTAHWSDSLQALVCNAGVAYDGPLRLTADGFEWNAGINHLGHARLTLGLLPRLDPGAPVVFTSSAAHRQTEDHEFMKAPRWTTAADLLVGTSDGPELTGRRYAISKLCNALFALELMRRHGVHSVIFEPGFVPGTGLARDQSPMAKLLFTWVLPAFASVMPVARTPRRAGRDLAQLVVDPPSAGSLVVGDETMPLPAVDRDEVRAAELWIATVAAWGDG